MKPSQGPPNFDRVAHIYRWAEWLTLGPLLGRTRRYFVPQLADRQNALVMGDGDGRFLSYLMSHHQHLCAYAVDISATMLRLLRERCLAASPTAEQRLQTEHISALHVIPDPKTDLIVTHFFLDCLTQIQTDALASQIAEAVEPGTLWLVSDFAVPGPALLRPFAAAFIRVLYAAFGMLTGLRVTHLPDPQVSLEYAGFVRIARKTFVFGLLYTELWELA